MGTVLPEDFKNSALGPIPKDWIASKIGNHVSKVGSGVTPKGGSDSYIEQGVPLIRSQNVRHGYLDLDDVAYISDEQHEKMHNSKLQPSDVLLNITGASIGRCCILPDNISEANVNQHVCIIRVKDDLLSGYVSHFMNSEYGQDQIWRLQAGGNREGLNFQQIRSFNIPVPRIPEQKKIAQILSTVDRKLELIDQQITATQTLKKGLMQKLFSEGVGSQDANGQWQPHTEFKDSKLGRIPARWSVSNIGEHIDLLSGYPFKSSNYITDEKNAIRLLRGDNIAQGWLRWRDGDCSPPYRVRLLIS
ncbi:restriction endonuclease subunit S [Endozoicomonas euniceicola]|uniref:Restriction endonuclease subunit S n=1 Tax=Endozoicomonas euniceicola TaxID=1234143 RepID=A0ABY6GPC5_9GAMM|nr:restriction endonuclease subunit S [Endozoicomonas euniceicola]UYM13963.1 restriction endonuclease subunit S [Endozoicomonas euniceicola]